MTTRPDSLGMQEAALALPDQIEESLARDLQTDEFPDASDIDQLVVMLSLIHI